MAFQHGQVNRDKVVSENPSEGFSKSVEFRPKTGTSQVRVLPPHPTSSVWFHKSNEHWVDGHGYVPCPRQFNKPCPICEEGEALYTSGDEDRVKQALDLRPREQYYYNVIVFSSGDGKASPKDGMKILRTGVKVFKQLRNLDNDEAGGWGDMTNLDNGFNVGIARSGATRTDTEYSITPVQSRGKTLTDMLASHGVDLNSLELFNLSDYVMSLSMSYEELKTKFENKQVAPGFPGGPRLSQPQVVGMPTMPDTHNVTTTGDAVAPPVIEE
jgi:hypothetical protein